MAGLTRKGLRRSPKVADAPLSKGKPKRKKKVTFNSPKTTKISYG